MRGLSAALLCACNVLGCRAIMETPDTGDARAMLLAFQRADGTLQVFAADPSARYALPFEAQAPEVYALFYRCELAALGIPSGPVPLAAPGDFRRYPLPTPSHSFQKGGSSDAWLPLSSLPAALTGLSFALTAPPKPTSCFKFDYHAVQLPDTEASSTLLAIPFDPEHVLASVTKGDQNLFFSVSAQLAEPLTALSAQHLPNNAGFRFPDGELILIGSSSSTPTLARGYRPELLMVDASARPPAGKPLRFDGTRVAGAAKELFAAVEVETMLELFHYDGQRWTSIVASTPRHSDSGVSWVGPGEAVAVGFQPRAVLRWKDGVRSDELVELDDGETATAVRELPGFGTLLGSNRGRVFRHLPSGQWALLGTSTLQVSIASFAPFADGALIGGDAGLLVQFDPQIGFCAPTPIGGGETKVLEVFQDGFVAATSNFAAQLRPATAIFVHPSAPPARQSDPCAP